MKYSPTRKRARTKDPNNHSDTETGPWLGSWGRDGLGRGGCCASSLAQAGIWHIWRIPITIVHIRFSYMMKVYGVTNTEIYEEPHYTVICDQRQVIMWWLMKSILSLNIIKKKEPKDYQKYLSSKKIKTPKHMIKCPDEKWPSYLFYVAQVPSVENEVHYFAQSQVSHSLMNKKHRDFVYHISYLICQLESGFPAWNILSSLTMMVLAAS